MMLLDNVILCYNIKLKKMEALKQIIVDVRTTEEWDFDGHAEGSVNYPLDTFENHIKELMSYDKIILVCRSGGRASVAQAQLRSAGYTKAVQNLGGWQNVASYA